MTPLVVDDLYSSFFEDERLFPVGTVQFDSALLMRGIDHEWLARTPFYCGETSDHHGHCLV
ncbi:MAG: hypothetical protein KDC35_08660 [Acidobacteria bacterium]|nr:hypothetical protein [Acidobacteriota bacterium]